jgi:hypothetical protein
LVNNNSSNFGLDIQRTIPWAWNVCKNKGYITRCMRSFYEEQTWWKGHVQTSVISIKPTAESSKLITVDPRTSNGLMFEQLETRTKNSRKIRFWNSNKNSKVEQRITWSPSLSAWSRWKKGKSPSSEQ